MFLRFPIMSKTSEFDREVFSHIDFSEIMWKVYD